MAISRDLQAKVTFVLHVAFMACFIIHYTNAMDHAFHAGNQDTSKTIAPIMDTARLEPQDRALSVSRFVSNNELVV